MIGNNCFERVIFATVVFAIHATVSCSRYERDILVLDLAESPGYEKDADDPYHGSAESIGYIKGV